MPRIRTIKPEFWADEKLAPLPTIDRLVFLGLVSMADDAGRLVDSVRQLDGMIFPYSDETCGPSLATLARLSRIRRYTSESGQRLIQIEGWTKHQYVDRPAKYVLPPPPPQTPATEPLEDARENLATSSRDPIAPTLDLGPTTYDLGPGSVDLPRTPAHTTAGDLGDRVNGNGSHPVARIQDDPLTPWLGPHAALVEDNPLIARPRDRRTLYAEYGPPGARAGAWKLDDGGTLPAEHRPRVFALALAGYAREGHRKLVTNQFAGMLRKLAGQESTLPRGSPNGSSTAPLTAQQYRRYGEIRKELEDGGMDPDEAAAEADRRARRE